MYMFLIQLIMFLKEHIFYTTYFLIRHIMFLKELIF